MSTPENISTKLPGKVRNKKRRWKIIIIILGALLCIRIALPYVILHYANKKLASLDGNYGHIEDIDLHLYRGAYVIKDIYIKKVSDKKDTSDFFSAVRIDLSVDWSAIFQKKFVGEVEFEKPVLQFILGKNIGKEAEKDTTNFIQLVRDFMPMRINRFAVHEGEIHYKDLGRSPVVDMPMTLVEIEGTGLTNEPDTTTLLPASITMHAKLYNGKINVNTKLDPLNKVPTFDLNCALTNTDLTNMNTFFAAYGKFDVEKGSMSMYCEVAAKDGEFSGYVKPLMTDMKIVHFDKEEGSPPQIAWEAVLGGAAFVLTNHPKDQVATRVPFSGKFENPDVGILPAIFAILGNAFIKALQPSLENTVSIGTVHEQQEKKGIIDRLFNRDDKKKNEKKRKK